jgi:6-pyruvoyltetrahydropterin/6-carboxytetrahydropterin synthase
MFSVGVRDHVMIAHSFKGEVFGPAQKMHGATFVVDVEFRAKEMNEAGIVVDIGRAHTTLGSILSAINYQNLDELEVFAGQNTTTEFLAKHIFESLKGEAKAGGQLGPGADALDSIKVTLNESHIAWASYEGSIAS